MFSQLSLAQKILYLALIFFVILMLIFTYKVGDHFGQEGYDRCIQKKCDVDPNWCVKNREIYNCCIGSNGEIGQQEGKIICVFS